VAQSAPAVRNFTRQFDEFRNIEIMNNTVQGYAAGNTKLFLLSDGLCGSACAMFSRYLQDNSIARIVVAGGLPTEAQQYASFGGGEVWSLGVLSSTTPIGDWLRQVAPNRMPPGFPRTLPYVGQDFAFVPRLWYSLENTSRLPMEFVFRPADIRLNYTRAMLLSEDSLYSATQDQIIACPGTSCNMCSISTLPCGVVASTTQCSAPLDGLLPIVSTSSAAPSHGAYQACSLGCVGLFAWLLCSMH